MHRIIMQTPKDQVVDHINGNGLDNRRLNLRNVTRRENGQNRVKLPVNNTTGYRGVQRQKNGKFAARVKKDKVIYHLGFFETVQDAAKVVKQWREKHHPGVTAYTV